MKHHWMLPVPDTNGTLNSTAKNTKRRQWWSAKIIRIGPPTSVKSFKWGKDTFQQGQLPKYPATLLYSREELEDFIGSL
jgi:hypothetical protein